MGVLRNRAYQDERQELLGNTPVTVAVDDKYEPKNHHARQSASLRHSHQLVDDYLHSGVAALENLRAQREMLRVCC